MEASPLLISGVFGSCVERGAVAAVGLGKLVSPTGVRGTYMTFRTRTTLGYAD